MRYTDFFDEFVRYLYRDSVRGGGFVNFDKLASDNYIPYEPGFLAALQRELKAKGYLEGPDPIAGDETALGRLTGEGLRYLESTYKDDLPEGPSDWRELRVSDGVSAEIVPAADRLVPLDHNLPEHLQVKRGLEELHEAVRSVNDLPERDRLLASLTAAESLWQAAELKIIQIKVGVIMVIEDAGRALAATAKAVGAALLVDAIKALVKAKTNIDLDSL